MIVVPIPGDFPDHLRPSAVTIGKFDGVHSGHAAVLADLVSRAEEHALHSVVVTFDRHPAELIRPGSAPVPVVSLEQKLELLEQAGVEATAVLAFTERLSQLTPIEFVRDLLVGKLGARLLTVGEDFRFGHKGAGDVALLRQLADELGYTLVVHGDEPGPDDRRASSTWVREALDAGDVELAAELLGRDHTLSGVVGHGAKRGRELGFPTANLEAATVEGFIPGDGVYAGWFTVDGKRYPSAISVGNNPTFDGVPQRQVEAHLIDEHLDLYDREVEVSFVHRIRGMEKFASIEALIDRMTADVEESRRVLAEDAARSLD